MKADQEGTHPLYRGKDWCRDNRPYKKTKKKTNWIGDNDTVFFVQATPGGELAKLWREEIKRLGGPVKIRVEEKGGKSIKSVFQNSNPNKTKGCERENCLVCINGKGEGGHCRKSNIGYTVNCDTCRGVTVQYVGETSKSGYQRGLGHLARYHGRNEDSPLWKHAISHHGGRLDVRYSMNVVRTFKEPLTRQVNEAVRMTRCEADVCLNSKSEWHSPVIVRLSIDENSGGVHRGVGQS